MRGLKTRPIGAFGLKAFVASGGEGRRLTSTIPGHFFHMATCPFSGRRSDDAPAAAAAERRMPLLERQRHAAGAVVLAPSLLRYAGLAALAAAPAFVGGRTQKVIAKAAKKLTGPTPVPAPGVSVPIGGLPKWSHAVGDPRGTDIAKAVGRTKEARFGVMFKRLPAFTPPDALLIAARQRR